MNQEFSKTIRAIISKYQPLLESYPEEELNHKPLIDKWSKKEILGHLIDSAYNNHQRFMRAEKKGDLMFDGYDQVEWVTKNNYQERKSREIIGLFVSVNLHLAHLISTLKDEDLYQSTTDHNFNQIGMRPIQKGTSSSLAYLIEDYIIHLEHHLKQIVPQNI
ncbi:MAG: DinB family protein [Bacteroidota bacterium]